MATERTGVEPVLAQPGQVEPGDALLHEVGGAPEARPRVQPALEHQLHLVRVAVLGGKLVVPADVLPDEAEPAYRHIAADLLQALPPQSLDHRLTGLLTAAR